eukprot:SAG22_NODE_557_length_9118_cov_9.050006_4_plen_73_part_00
MTINLGEYISDQPEVVVKKKVNVDKRVFAGWVAAVVLLVLLSSVFWLSVYRVVVPTRPPARFPGISSVLKGF